MKKIKMAYKKRIIALVAACVMTAVFSLMFVLLGLNGFPIEKTMVTASYGATSEIIYDLVFEDSPFYNENELEFGEGYITQYVDAIDLNFIYNFNCVNAADISGIYSVDAVLEASYNSTYLIWEKEYQLIPGTSFGSGQLSEGLTLPLNEYAETAEKIESDTGVSTSATMTITFTVDVSAQIAGAPVTDTSVSTLVFDLSEDVMVMSGEPKQEHISDIEETIMQEVIPRTTALIISVPLLVFSLGGFLFLLILTRGILEDPVKLQLDKLNKRYSSRIAELTPGTNLGKYDNIAVRSFKDLLLTADELKKPIFKNNADNYADVEFYVIDDIRVYIFSAEAFKTDSGRDNDAGMGYLWIRYNKGPAD